MKKKKFPYIPQLDSTDCGPACLRMIMTHYGAENVQLSSLTNQLHIGKQGSSLVGISKLAETLGFKTLSVRIDFERLVKNNVPFPAIFFWNQKHFVVVTQIKDDKVWVTDPAFGHTVYSKEEFLKGWYPEEEEGIVLFVEPTPLFYTNKNNGILGTGKNIDKANFSFILKYLFRYKLYVFLLLAGLLLGSFVDMIVPFLTKNLIDKGIMGKGLSFIYLVIAAQFIVYIVSFSMEYIRSWIFMHISTRLSTSIISDFLAKLMKLPINFFNSKQMGDITKRIDDHHKIERFITQNVLKSIFAIFSIITLSLLLIYINSTLFFVFAVGASVQVIWILNFIDKMKNFEYKMIALLSEDRNKVYELLTGMQEIKLNNLEYQKRWEWEKVQASMFKVNLDRLGLKQKYELYKIFAQAQSLCVSFISAVSVVNGSMTLGDMMVALFILGHLNSPIGELINFVLEGQIVKVSLERLSEIHQKEDEELEELSKLHELPENKDIEISNLSFRYGDEHFPKVLSDISMKIPFGKTTAIVGASGSGKTTLIKLLLKFYISQEGFITIGNTSLQDLNSSFWRGCCGSVMQDSFIFSESIAYNICLGEDVDEEKLTKAVQIANIKDFIESLPLKYATKIGGNGTGLSQGQKQRILIARAVYKNPDYMFFDEATNALDANNEKIITRNLESFFRGKTVVVVAHRLSTVINADQIILLDKGQIAEIGSHEELISIKGKYYELIKNQLELGN